MGGVIHIAWYATVFRQDALAQEVSHAAPLALRYGATQYAVHRSQDDPYKIIQMAWFENHEQWYRFWDGPEMIEFRARNAGHFQILVTYTWHDELVADSIAAPVPDEPEVAPRPQPATPQAAQ